MNKIPIDRNRHYTVAEAAKLLKVSTSSLYNWTSFEHPYYRNICASYIGRQKIIKGDQLLKLVSPDLVDDVTKEEAVENDGGGKEEQ